MTPRAARHLTVRLAVFTFLAAAMVWPILVDAARLNEFRDVHCLMLYERSAIDTIRRFGELPLWNPYYCGGFDAVAAPQTRFVSPTLLLGLLFGAERAEILTVFFFAIVGMEGMYRWLSLRVRDPRAALAVAPVFALSGQYAVAYYRGWIQFMGFELVPWILFGVVLAARRKASGVAIAAIAFAWMLGFAGFFAVPLVAVAALLEATRAYSEEPLETRARSALVLVATASFMATVAWLRLWPVAETLTSAPRVMAGTPGHLPRALVAAVIGALDVSKGNTHVEGSFYVGGAFLVVAVLGASQRGALTSLLMAIICGWLAMGYLSRFSAFALLRAIPGLESVRYPERFLWVAILFASGSAARALEGVPRLVAHRTWRLAATTVLGAAVAWTVATEIQAFHRVAAARSLGTVAEDDRGEFHQSRGNRWLTVHLESQNIGSLGCYETHRVAESTLLRGDLPAEEYLAPDSVDAGTVERLAWSPNKIVLRANVSRPARVLVNQNWAPGWHASVGQVVSHEGLLAVDVPAGAREVALTFRPWTTLAGAGVTMIALAALAWIVWRERKGGDIFSRRRWAGTALLVAVPWAAAGAAYAASPDDRWPPHVARNPNGAPALVEPGDRHDGAVLGAAFALPLRVEEGHVSGPDAHGNILAEVYFRRLARVARSTTMFVHVERRGSEPKAMKDEEVFFNADHQVVGGTFYLSDAPEGRLVRDAFGVHLDKAARGTWDVWVAFGHVSGRRPRSAVVDAGKAEVNANRVKVGTFFVP